MEIHGWQMDAVGAPLREAIRTLNPEALAPGVVLVEVAGCGVCHTDLGFLFDGVPTRHPLPLTLGHEIAGVVRHAGPGAEAWVGEAVVVPAVIPCGQCALCRAGRGAICKAQLFPGNDDHGGFASHVKVPAHGLCKVDVTRVAAAGLTLADLSVVADAVTTPYQAILNSGLAAGDLAIFVGAGGVGSFGVQLAKARGAKVAVLDVDPDRVERARACGADWVERSAGAEPRELKKQLGAWAKAEGLPAVGWRIFETSGHPDGQALAFSLLVPGAHLGVVGYTAEKVSLRLSNLMAFDATARGTWGCLPDHYPAVVELVLSGAVDVKLLSERHPMSQINALFNALHAGSLKKRPVLIPDFQEGGL
jgi:6-hydroxycyclohex-1-ene-1-carbonyl-CoA dehydrogenase